jgi:predicted dehydrogenase
MGTVAAAPIRTAVVGFGISGKVFHAPLIAADPQYSLDVIVTADPARAAEAARLYPQARIVPTPEEMFAQSAGLDLVVLGTPPHTHFDLAAAAIAHGLHVVVDKPFVPASAQGAELIALASDGGVQLTVFQNRRWDAEHLTLRALLDEGRLGEVMRFERRWERWRPQPKDRWRENASPAEGGGILLDLHSHLVDSAVQLFGPVRRVYAEIAARTTRADDEVFLALEHVGGVRSHLGAHSLIGAPGPRTRVLGHAGAYLVANFESDMTAYRDFADPDDDSCGWLVAGEERTAVPRAPGGHADFYRAVAAAVRGQGPVPVDPWDAVHVLDVLDAARRSDAEHAVVEVPG